MLIEVLFNLILLLFFPVSVMFLLKVKVTAGDTGIGNIIFFFILLVIGKMKIKKSK